MGMPLVAGREFTDKDVAGAPKVAIINETMAKYFFGDANPIGRRIGFGRDNATDIEIVGVVQRRPEPSAARRSRCASSTSRTRRTTR